MLDIVSSMSLGDSSTLTVNGKYIYSGNDGSALSRKCPR